MKYLLTRDEAKEQVEEDIRTFMLAFPADYDDGKVRASSEYITNQLCIIASANINRIDLEGR
mgnify:CR=1 FL=1|tara:strand:+ start:4849 stop:5034 length:186 start_codon:yes stop_codon:yes gene_type:complete